MNGITVVSSVTSTNAGKCYCETGVTGVKSDNDFKTCYTTSTSECISSTANYRWSNDRLHLIFPKL